MKSVNPTSIKKATHILMENNGTVKIIVSDTALILDQASGKIKADILVEITSISELLEIFPYLALIEAFEFCKQKSLYRMLYKLLFL